jgi:hypothetical protein
MFLKEELDSLAKQHRELEDGIASLDTAVEEIEREAVSRDTVKAALEKRTGCPPAFSPTSRRNWCVWCCTRQCSPRRK